MQVHIICLYWISGSRLHIFRSYRIAKCVQLVIMIILLLKITKFILEFTQVFLEKSFNPVDFHLEFSNPSLHFLFDYVCLKVFWLDSLTLKSACHRVSDCREIIFKCSLNNGGLEVAFLVYFLSSKLHRFRVLQSVVVQRIHRIILHFLLILHLAHLLELLDHFHRIQLRLCSSVISWGILLFFRLINITDSRLNLLNYQIDFNLILIFNVFFVIELLFVRG